jgi:transposase
LEKGEYTMLNIRDKNVDLTNYEFICLDNLVPQDHLLRKIDRYIDFSFIDELVKDLYCHDNGRPAIDPKILIKTLLIGYLYGIRSERQIIREVQVNAAYRWFLGYTLSDKIIDASTISQNRRRRFRYRYI